MRFSTGRDRRSRALLGDPDHFELPAGCVYPEPASRRSVLWISFALLVFGIGSCAVLALVLRSAVRSDSAIDRSRAVQTQVDRQVRARNAIFCDAFDGQALIYRAVLALLPPPASETVAQARFRRAIVLESDKLAVLRSELSCPPPSSSPVLPLPTPTP